MKSLPVLFALCACAACAAPKIEDLGEHLAYVRIHSLPGDLPSAKDSRHPWIIDLRFVRAGSDEARLLNAWVRVTGSPASPIFILANEGTSPDLLERFERRPRAEVMLLAPKGSDIPADVLVNVTEKTDRKAYEAYEHGSTIAALTTDFPDKPRIDEETLAKEHIPDSQAPDAPEEDPDHPTPPPPLIDRVLQRAIHIDEGLVALRKL